MRCRVVHLLIKGRYQSQRFKRRGQRGECKEKARGAVPRKSCLGSDLMKVSFPCESVLMGEYVSELHIRRNVENCGYVISVSTNAVLHRLAYNMASCFLVHFLDFLLNPFFCSLMH